MGELKRYFLLASEEAGKRELCYIFPGRRIIAYYPEERIIEQSSNPNHLEEFSLLLAEREKMRVLRQAGKIAEGTISVYELEQIEAMLKRKDAKMLRRNLLGLALRLGALI
jgi:hypothetical protein